MKKSRSVEPVPITARGKRLRRRQIRPAPARYRAFITSVRCVTGYLAMWAVRQSPYGWPDGLEKVVKRLERALKDRIRRDPWSSGLVKQAGMFKINQRQLEALLHVVLAPSREFRRWNQRKNGNKAPFGFSSRYDVPNANPDDDFIDLDALLRNVAHSAASEAVADG